MVGTEGDHVAKSMGDTHHYCPGRVSELRTICSLSLLLHQTMAVAVAHAGGGGRKTPPCKFDPLIWGSNLRKRAVVERRYRIYASRDPLFTRPCALSAPDARERWGGELQRIIDPSVSVAQGLGAFPLPLD